MIVTNPQQSRGEWFAIWLVSAFGKTISQPSFIARKKPSDFIIGMSLMRASPTPPLPSSRCSTILSGLETSRLKSSTTSAVEENAKGVMGLKNRMKGLAC